MEPIIQLDEVYYRYGQEWVLENLNLAFRRGEFAVIAGPNGSGKTTMLQLILGLLRPQRGRVLLFGQPAEKCSEREKIGYMSQKSQTYNSGIPATVFEVVRSGLTKKAGLFRPFPPETEKSVMDALRMVGMERFSGCLIRNLSGGQQQRVFIARALVAKPDLLVMDEPTVGLDRKRVDAFYHLLDEFSREQKMTLLLVTHHLDRLPASVSRVICLNRTIRFDGRWELFLQVRDSVSGKEGLFDD